MIKLKSILQEIHLELNELDRFPSGEYEYTLEFDGQNILALSKSADTIKIIVDINYDGKADSIEGYEILDITIIGDNGNEKNVNWKFLHPRQRQIIDNLVDKEILENESKIIEKIRNSSGEL